MRHAVPTFLVLAAATFAAFLASPAEARQGRGRDDVAADASSAAAGSSLSIRLREKSRGRWEFRMQLERAASGLSPQVWIADGAGTLVLAGDLVPDDNDAGEYKLRLRSQKGGALPAGATSISDLGGRAYEVRESGSAIFSGSLPSIETKGARSSADATPGGTSGGGADDPATHDVGDDHGVDDPATHDVGDDHGGATSGSDDPATHDAADDNGGASGGGSGRGRGRGRGSNDPAKRGADDPAGHVRHGRGAHHAAGHR